MQLWIYSIEIKGYSVILAPDFFVKSSENYLPIQSYHAPDGLWLCLCPRRCGDPHNAISLYQVPSHEKLMYEKSYHFFYFRLSHKINSKISS